MSVERILVVHNAYLHRGGEDSVVEAEVALLASKGHDVRQFIRSNDEIGRQGLARTALDTLWSTSSAHAVEQVIADFRPDVIHAHNTFPLISPSIYWTAHRARVPVVQTLHNFRLLCPQAMFLRHGRICEDCLGHLPLPGMLRGCYRDSIPQSSLLGAMSILHRSVGTYRNRVTRYVALNEFCRDKFIQGGLPPEKIVVKPNFVHERSHIPGRRSGLLFVGRLSPEKGIHVLAEVARRLPDGSVTVIGEGPEARLLEGIPAVRMLGYCGSDAVAQAMRNAIALLVPSVWHETFGMTAIEAFSAGTPVVASRIGNLASLVRDGENGLLSEPGSVESLFKAASHALRNPDAMAAMGGIAYQDFRTHYSAEKNYRMLTGIYEDAIAARATAI